MIVLHKVSPDSVGGDDAGDRLVVDLSPLRLPEEFASVERELTERMWRELHVERRRNVEQTPEVRKKDEEGRGIFEDSRWEESILDPGTTEDAWERRPIFQLPPYSLSWKVSRQQGKHLGRLLAEWFDTAERNAAASMKPKGVKPGKGRRSGGYGIG